MNFAIWLIFILLVIWYITWLNTESNKSKYRQDASRGLINKLDELLRELGVTESDKVERKKRIEVLKSRLNND